MWAAPLIGAGASLLGSFLSREKPRETPIQQQQRQLIDELLGSLHGQGPYSDLFNASEADFQRSFADPARQRFRDITTPQIQQGFIQSGLQRGTGLQDELARAGVDMDQLLNQQWMDYMQGAQNRRAGAIGQILGQGAGVAPQQSIGETLGQGFAGYLSDGFGTDIERILKGRRDQSVPQQPVFDQPRQGFERS